MSDCPSPFYPPRARWNRHFYQAAYALRRCLHLDQLDLMVPFATAPWRFLLSFLLPGFAFRDAGWKKIGAALTAAWITSVSVFLVCLGYAAANFAFGLMISMHVSSVLYVLNRISPGMALRRRLILSLAVLVLVGQVVYGFGLNLVQDHWFMPLRSGDKVYIINRKASLAAIHRGDLVAYHTEGAGSTGVRIRGGYLLDRVIADSGDEVAFDSATFLVNGIPYPKLPLMPSAGRVAVPEKTWLVWPSLHTVTRNNVADETIARSVLEMALVSRAGIIGKPFAHWFWRNQSL